MNFVLKMMDFMLTMMKIVMKMMNFVLKMVGFLRLIGKNKGMWQGERTRLRGQSDFHVDIFRCQLWRELRRSFGGLVRPNFDRI